MIQGQPDKDDADVELAIGCSSVMSSVTLTRAVSVQYLHEEGLMSKGGEELDNKDSPSESVVIMESREERKESGWGGLHGGMNYSR